MDCGGIPLFARADRRLGRLWNLGSEDKQFDEGHARVMAELAVFAGLAMRMIAPTKELKEAVEQPETLTREMSHGLTCSPSQAASFP
jgi:hypothetical protein